MKEVAFCGQRVVEWAARSCKVGENMAHEQLRTIIALAATMLPSFANCHIPAEQHRHEQLTAMQAAFSRFNGGISGTVDTQDLPNFLRYVVASMQPAAMDQQELISRSSELTTRLTDHLPDRRLLTLNDILNATEKILIYPPEVEETEEANERGRLGELPRARGTISRAACRPSHPPPRA